MNYENYDQYEHEKDLKLIKHWTIIVIATLLFFWLPLAIVFADETPRTPEMINQYVDAIYHAEGGEKTNHPFGILSVSCNGYDECRKICYNTVRNNVKRFDNQEVFDNYLEFLASRYAPIGVANDPTNLNQNWIKNVRWFLND